MMMEGGQNPKKMARSKRASSQRSKAKHSRYHAHGASGTAAAIRERIVAEDSLPSNWTRYGDASGSEEDLPPLAEGEIRSKSKGADYRELLSSDVPRLFEEAPEMEGMTAMLLANGLGLWDWDSSYLEPASLSSERQSAREASALLTVDMRLLGKSLVRLDVAQRLFLEDEVFPKQNDAGHGPEIVYSSPGISDPEAPAIPMKDGLVQEQDNFLPDTSVSSGHAQVSAELSASPVARDRSSFNRDDLNMWGETISSVGAGTSLLGSSGANSPPGNNSGLNCAPKLSNAWDHKIDTQAQMRLEISKDATDVKTFEAAAAEAELDDLLNMLDNQVAGISLKKDIQLSFSKSSFFDNGPILASYPASSTPPGFGFQEFRVGSRIGEVTPDPLLRATPKYVGPSPEIPKQLEKIDSSSHAKAADVVLSQDDDFDSWLDSI